MDSFRCVECDKTFSTVSNLNRHAKLIHNKASTIKQLRCNICSAELISKKALEDHIDLVHNIAVEKDIRTFDTFEDFKLWKESIEKQTSSLYVKNTGSKSEKTGGKITYFYCHRSGYYNARGNKKRNMKKAGSNKINGNCPSKMKVYEDIESKVTVEFTKTHVGHVIDLGQKEISKEEFQKECMLLINKASPEQYDNILTFLRNTVISSHLFLESRTLNMEPQNKKIKTDIFQQRRRPQKASTTLRKPTQEECQSVSTSLVLKAKSL